MDCGLAFEVCRGLGRGGVDDWADVMPVSRVGLERRGGGLSLALRAEGGGFTYATNAGRFRPK